MRCVSLRLHNFRNIKTGEIQWSEGLNLLLGDNGSGKTNCLEALHLLLGWGPIGDRRDVPTWGGSGRAFITGQFAGEEEALLAMGVGASSVLKYNGRRCSCSEARSVAPSLAFLPSDMALLDGAPSRRRSFIDRLCALLWPLYALRLSDFRRAVRHRVALLRRGGDLGPLSEAMAPLASWIWGARESAVAALSEELLRVGELLPAPLDLALSRGGAGRVESRLDDWWESLDAAGPRERACCTPLVGPHRDDIEFMCGDIPASSRLSRGHKRRASAALVIAAGRCIVRRLRRAPLLLIDEMASELDRAGREIFVESLRATGWQVIGTAAEAVIPDWPGRVIRVRGGVLTPAD